MSAPSYELHPLCTLFPRLSGAEFDALKDDIKVSGLRAPIVLHDGMILDGGNRYRACIEAGVPPRFEPFQGESVLGFVLSANLHRRHLTPGQQAAIVASAQDWATAQAVGKPKSGNVAPLSTVADRAAQSGASERTQRMADKVAKAAPDLAQQVARGEVSLPAAVRQVEQKAGGADAGDSQAQGKVVPATRTRRPAAADSTDLESLRDELDAMRDSAEALLEVNNELRQENNALRAAAKPDALAEIQRLQQYIGTVERQRDGYQNENAELKREVKSLRRRMGVNG